MNEFLTKIKDWFTSQKKTVITIIISFLLGCATIGAFFYLSSRNYNNIIQQLRTDVTIISTQLRDSIELNKQLQQSNRKLEDDLRTAKETLTRSIEQVRDIKAQLSEANRRLSESTEYSKQLAEQISASRLKLAEFEKRIGELQEYISGITEKLQQYLTRITSLENRVSADLEFIRGLQEQVDSYSRRVKELEITLGQLSADSSELNQAIGTITTGFTSITSTSSDIGDILTKLLEFVDLGLKELGRIQEIGGRIDSQINQSIGSSN